LIAHEGADAAKASKEPNGEVKNKEKGLPDASNQPTKKAHAKKWSFEQWPFFVLALRDDVARVLSPPP
jgi:hypothetical protein